MPENQNEMGATIRGIQGTGPATLNELTFDPVTGDFVQVPKGTNADGVKIMNEGFANH